MNDKRLSFLGTQMAIKVIVWGENVHEGRNQVVADLYPDGMHAQIARQLASDSDLSVGTATLQEPEHGLSDARLAGTDVLFWWGHLAHGQVDDAIVERVTRRVWEGMGLVLLHSAHFSKIFKRLMGTACSLRWREAGERERIWVVNPRHPIAEGLPQHFVLENEEMYGEPFSIPEPLETVLISWFQGGEVFRSGVTYRRGAGNVFYFRPGHETYPTYHDSIVGTVLRNAAKWAASAQPRLEGVVEGPNVPVGSALEPIPDRSPKKRPIGQSQDR
jgi:trehalose utilization protein